ncbi:hypothetical protein QYE76_043843 [Lolium multiflorum]|uniref:Uncharacterized protein n=1 Tax=Lolium multiflorum TaxID=4521 RepID=A0AAD8WW76_LOLMU|nr:hypothetical protein QYE76_043843 [Lolium multiflorum]
MAYSGDVEAVPEHCAAHPAEAGMGGSAEATEKSRPVAAETTSSDHHEAVEAPEQAARMSTSMDREEEKLLSPTAKEEEAESTRDRLKRHRREMAGRVWVPEMWGQEKLLKDWLDCSAFDRPLVPAGLLTARRALVAESCARRPAPTPQASSSPLRVQNGCS